MKTLQYDILKNKASNVSEYGNFEILIPVIENH